MVYSVCILAIAFGLFYSVNAASDFLGRFENRSVLIDLEMPLYGDLDVGVHRYNAIRNVLDSSLEINRLLIRLASSSSKANSTKITIKYIPRNLIDVEILTPGDQKPSSYIKEFSYYNEISEGVYRYFKYLDYIEDERALSSILYSVDVLNDLKQLESLVSSIFLHQDVQELFEMTYILNDKEISLLSIVCNLNANTNKQRDKQIRYSATLARNKNTFNHIVLNNAVKSNISQNKNLVLNLLDKEYSLESIPNKPSNAQNPLVKNLTISLKPNKAYHNEILISNLFTTHPKHFNTNLDLLIILTEDMYIEKTELLEDIKLQGFAIHNVSSSNAIDQEQPSALSKQYFFRVILSIADYRKLLSECDLRLKMHVRYQDCGRQAYRPIRVKQPEVRLVQEQDSSCAFEGLSDLSDRLGAYHSLHAENLTVSIPIGNSNLKFLIVVLTLVTAVFFALLIGLQIVYTGLSKVLN